MMKSDISRPDPYVLLMKSDISRPDPYVLPYVLLVLRARPAAEPGRRFERNL